MGTSKITVSKILLVYRSGSPISFIFIFLSQKKKKKRNKEIFSCSVLMVNILINIMNFQFIKRAPGTLLIGWFSLPRISLPLSSDLLKRLQPPKLGKATVPSALGWGLVQGFFFHFPFSKEQEEN